MIYYLPKLADGVFFAVAICEKSDKSSQRKTTESDMAMPRRPGTHILGDQGAVHSLAPEALCGRPGTCHLFASEIGMRKLGETHVGTGGALQTHSEALNKWDTRG